MNRNIASLSIAAALAFAGAALAADMPGMDMPAKAPTSQPSAAVVDLHNTKCAVSGEDIGPSTLTETYDGKIYHFCCADCPKMFTADPAKYAKAVAADPAKYGIK